MAILFTIIILVYSVVLAKYVPERWHIISNIIFSLLAIGFGLWAGSSFTALGLSLSFVLQGVVVAVLCSLAIAVIAGCVVFFLPKKHTFALPQITRSGKIAYETAVRIPLSTALSEEILFRGVLLAVLQLSFNTLPSIIICSIVFGLWHVLPSTRDYSKGAILPILLATTVAGMFFCWLRILAGSIIAPWLVHWTINSSALLAIHIMRKKAA